ncbi:hypothetical protein [Leptospira kanakyensis]|uniref:Uncharacterized protein n=1 Tax=Leptospira kanakyensis TaxID=2484968 RepID=A0A6N4Q9F0_9LEPT|nr:hypothetical protein [Leptospira kanakyensis]TGK67391.1 hypothetical protein EHQ18_15875 [Leptospira kanakyensis]
MIKKFPIFLFPLLLFNCVTLNRWMQFKHDEILPELNGSTILLKVQGFGYSDKQYENRISESIKKIASTSKNIKFAKSENEKYDYTLEVTFQIHPEIVRRLSPTTSNGISKRYTGIYAPKSEFQYTLYSINNKNPIFIYSDSIYATFKPVGEKYLIMDTNSLANRMGIYFGLITSNLSKSNGELANEYENILDNSAIEVTKNEKNLILSYNKNPDFTKFNEINITEMIFDENLDTINSSFEIKGKRINTKIRQGLEIVLLKKYNNMIVIDIGYIDLENRLQIFERKIFFNSKLLRITAS